MTTELATEAARLAGIPVYCDAGIPTGYPDSVGVCKTF